MNHIRLSRVLQWRQIPNIITNIFEEYFWIKLVCLISVVTIVYFIVRPMMFSPFEGMWVRICKLKKIKKETFFHGCDNLYHFLGLKKSRHFLFSMIISSVHMMFFWIYFKRLWQEMDLINDFQCMSMYVNISVLECGNVALRYLRVVDNTRQNPNISLCM